MQPRKTHHIMLFYVNYVNSYYLISNIKLLQNQTTYINRLSKTLEIKHNINIIEAE